MSEEIPAQIEGSVNEQIQEQQTPPDENQDVHSHSELLEEDNKKNEPKTMLDKFKELFVEEPSENPGIFTKFVI